MSLTSLLDTDERFREIVKEHLPNRKLFRTNTGDKAFSTKYKLLRLMSYPADITAPWSVQLLIMRRGLSLPDSRW